MFNLKNIVNKITDRGRDSQPNSPGVADDPLNNQGAEGFLCPKCMTAYPSPEELQSHYEELHNSAEGGDAAVAGFGVLHQEAGFHLQRQAQGGQSIIHEKLSAEIQGITNVAELQKSLMDALESKAQLQFEKESLEQRTAQLARVNAAMKSVNDEEQGKTQALKDRLNILEDQLAHRESIDDAAVLRQELVQVQRVMDELTRERERERDELQSELHKLQTSYEVFQQNSDNSEKVAELQMMITKDQASKQQMEKQAKKMEAILEQEKNKNSELLAEINALKMNVKELVAGTKTAGQTAEQSRQQAESLKLEAAASKSSLQEKTAEAESLSRDLRNTKAELESLVAKVDSLTNAQAHAASLIKDKDERLAKLAADLKRHASEGAGAAKAAVQQLAEENEARLREILDANTKLKSEKQESEDVAAKAKSDSQKKETRIFELVKELEECAAKVVVYEKGLSTERLNAESLQLKLDAEVDKNAALRETLNELQVSSQKEREQLVEKNAKCRTLQDKIDKTLGVCSALEEQKKQLEILKTSLETTIFEKEKADSENQDYMQDLRDEVMRLGYDLDVRTSLLHSTETELRTSREEVGMLAEDLSTQLAERAAENLERKDFLDRTRLTFEAILERMTKSIEEKDETIAAINAKQKESEEQHAVVLDALKKDHELCVEELTAKIGGLNQRQKETEDQLQSAIGKNDNAIAELKRDCDAKSEELKAMQLALDEITGDKLVLEAHLQTSQTEQKTLMEKYYASSSDNEAQRRNLDEFRRRCEDSQSGLHELGRENQILRMELEKLLGRKWTEDSDVASCHLCHKEFTLLVRKHHCRNCGQIFCNECSAKNAAVANNKKPVRVCDGCYNELAAAM